MVIKLFFFYFIFVSVAFCDFFDEKRMTNSPIFQDNKKGIIYFGASAGMSFYNQFNLYNFNNIKMQFPIFTITAGYKTLNSSFRHELNFSYLDFKSEKKDFNYLNVNYELKFNVTKYYFLYNLYYNTANLLNSKKNDLQFFIGPGAGVVFNKVNFSGGSSDFISYIKSFDNNNGFAFAYELSMGLDLKLSELWVGQIKGRYIIDNGSFKNKIFKINSQIFALEIGILFKAL